MDSRILKPCPFCGTTDIKFNHVEDAHDVEVMSELSLRTKEDERDSSMSDPEQYEQSDGEPSLDIFL